MDSKDINQKDLLLAVDGLATGAVATGEVTTLEHELGDDTVELGAGVTEAVLASAESTEVLGGLGDDVSAQLHDDAANGLLVDGNIEVNYLTRNNNPSKRAGRDRENKMVLVNTTRTLFSIAILICTILALTLVHVFVVIEAASSEATRKQTDEHVALHNQQRTRQQNKDTRSVGNIFLFGG